MPVRMILVALSVAVAWPAASQPTFGLHDEMNWFTGEPHHHPGATSTLVAQEVGPGSCASPTGTDPRPPPDGVDGTCDAPSFGHPYRIAGEAYADGVDWMNFSSHNNAAAILDYSNMGTCMVEFLGRHGSTSYAELGTDDSWVFGTTGLPFRAGGTWASRELGDGGYPRLFDDHWTQDQCDLAMIDNPEIVGVRKGLLCLAGVEYSGPTPDPGHRITYGGADERKFHGDIANGAAPWEPSDDHLHWSRGLRDVAIPQTVAHPCANALLTRIEPVDTSGPGPHNKGVDAMSTVGMSIKASVSPTSAHCIDESSSATEDWNTLVPALLAGNWFQALSGGDGHGLPRVDSGCGSGSGGTTGLAGEHSMTMAIVHDDMVEDKLTKRGLRGALWRRAFYWVKGHGEDNGGRNILKSEVWDGASPAVTPRGITGFWYRDDPAGDITLKGQIDFDWRDSAIPADFHAEVRRQFNGTDVVVASGDTQGGGIGGVTCTHTPVDMCHWELARSGAARGGSYLVVAREDALPVSAGDAHHLVAVLAWIATADSQFAGGPPKVVGSTQP